MPFYQQHPWSRVGQSLVAVPGTEGTAEVIQDPHGLPPLRGGAWRAVVESSGPWPAMHQGVPGNDVGWQLYTSPRLQWIPDRGINSVGFVLRGDVVNVLTYGQDGWALVEARPANGRGGGLPLVTGYLCFACINDPVSDPRFGEARPLLGLPAPILRRIDWPPRVVAVPGTGPTTPALRPVLSPQRTGTSDAVRFDANIDPTFASEVQDALANEQDPGALESWANNAGAMGYPVAERLLRARAAYFASLGYNDTR